MYDIQYTFLKMMYVAISSSFVVLVHRFSAIQCRYLVLCLPL